MHQQQKSASSARLAEAMNQDAANKLTPRVERFTDRSEETDPRSDRADSARARGSESFGSHLK